MYLKDGILGVSGVRGLGGVPGFGSCTQQRPSHSRAPMLLPPRLLSPLVLILSRAGQGTWHSPSEEFMKLFVHASVELSTATQTDIFVRWLSS